MIIASVISVILVWFFFGFVAMGYDYAYYQRKYPTIADVERKKDARYAYETIPFGLIAYSGTSRECGWLYPNDTPTRHRPILTFRQTAVRWLKGLFVR